MDVLHGRGARRRLNGSRSATVCRQREELRSSDGEVAHLKASLRISKWDYDHTIDWLPCLSAGRVGFTDGRSAYWSIAEGGGSSVRFDDGQEVHLYCANCRLPRTGSWRHGGLP